MLRYVSDERMAIGMPCRGFDDGGVEDSDIVDAVTTFVERSTTLEPSEILLAMASNLGWCLSFYIVP